jgi:hypothetical protein
MRSILNSGVTLQVNNANTILLNYLQNTVSIAKAPIADISNFIPTTYILELYKSTTQSALQKDLVAQIKKARNAYLAAANRAQKAEALNKLNKYPEIQQLIKDGIPEADLDTSKEMEAIRQIYANEPLRFLDAQIDAANSFINSTSVQTQVASDFDSNEFQAFDVNNGDNNCQSRVFLMEIFCKQVPYDNLSPEEKLVLTLSNITSKYKKEVRDVFGILTKEVDNGNVQYGTLMLSSAKVTPQIKINTNAFYSVRDLIGMAISQISTAYMLGVANMLEDCELKQDLIPYNRKMQNSDKRKPAQQMQAPSIEAMFRLIELTGMPFAYKITRLAETILSDKNNEFKLQGVALVNNAGAIITSSDTVPTVIFELFSVNTEACKKRAVGSALENLAATSAFVDYLDELEIFGIRRLIQLCDVRLDERLQTPKTVAYNSIVLKDHSQTSRDFDKCLSGQYTIGSFRSSEGILFEPCHIYVSNTQRELAKIRILEVTNPTAGKTI